MEFRSQLIKQAACVLAAGMVIARAADSVPEEPPPSFWQRDRLTGDWGGWRPRMLEQGIDFSPVFIGEVMGNVSGGLYGPGAVYDQSLNLPLTLDLEALLGWPSASVHANAFWIAGNSLTEQCVGDLANVSNISADPSVRLQELWFQQGFYNATISLRAGLLAADNEFFGANSATLFINGTFGAFPLVGANLPNPPIYPMAAPAVRLLLQSDSGCYFQAAAFDGNSGTQDGNPSGTDFPLSKGEGALVFSELGFVPPYGRSTNALTGIVKVGAFLLTKRVPDWTDQAAGNYGGGGMNYGLYGVAEQDLIRSEERVVSVFARGGYAPPGRNVIDWYVDAGVNFTGLLPGRKYDVAGIAVARSNFSDDYSLYQQSIYDTPQFSSEAIVEVTYAAKLAPWWLLQPDFQYIVAPGGNSQCRAAVVLGLRTTVIF